MNLYWMNEIILYYMKLFEEDVIPFVICTIKHMILLTKK